MFLWRTGENYPIIFTKYANSSAGVILEGDLGEKVPKLADFSLSWAEGEVKMYRMDREIQNLDHNFSLKSWTRLKTYPSLKALGWPLLCIT